MSYNCVIPGCPGNHPSKRETCLRYTLVNELREWIGFPEKDLDVLLRKAAETIEQAASVLLLAEHELKVVQREIRGIAPEAQSQALPKIKDLIDGLVGCCGTTRLKCLEYQRGNELGNGKRCCPDCKHE